MKSTCRGGEAGEQGNKMHTWQSADERTQNEEEFDRAERNRMELYEVEAERTGVPERSK